MGLLPDFPRPISKVGRPPKGLGSRLSTKAWVRFLLDQLPEVERWATKGGAPSSWSEQIKTEAIKDGDEIRKPLNVGVGMRQLFGLKAKAPKFHVDRLQRSPRTLDTLFSVLATGGRNSFEKHYAYGTSKPSDELFGLAELLIPGSLRAYSHPPAPLDPWFYAALNFENPWTGWFFQVRRIQLEFTTEFIPTGLSPGHMLSDVDDEIESVARRLFSDDLRTRWQMGAAADSELRRFESNLAEAAACALFPDEAPYSDEGLRDAIESLNRLCDAAAHGAVSVIPKLSMPPDSVAAWSNLTDAIAAHRMTQIVELRPESRGYAEVWLRSALQNVAPALDRVDRHCFCRAPIKGKPAIQGVLEASGCWYSEQISEQ